MPQVAPFGLGEEKGGVDGRADGKRQATPQEDLPDRAGVVVKVSPQFKQPPHGGDGGEADEQDRAAGEPTAPLRAQQDVEEALRLLQVIDQQAGGKADEEQGEEAAHQGGEAVVGDEVQPPAQGHEHEEARAQPFGHQVGGHRPMPGDFVLEVVANLHHLFGHGAAKLDGTLPGLSLGLPLAQGHARFGSAGGHGRDWGMTVVVAIPGRGVQRQHIGPHKRLRRALGGRGVHGHVAALNVKQLGRGALLRLAHRHILASQQGADLAGGVVHVPGDDRVLRADHHTGRLQADIGAVGAVVALGRRARLRIDVDGVVGAGLHTRLAADTKAVIELHNAVGPLVHGLRGADTHTGRVGAVVTACHLKMAASVRVEAGFNVFHPGTAHPQGHFVLRFAGDGTGVAANTFAVVNDKTVVLGLISRDGNVYGHAHFLVGRENKAARTQAAESRRR